MFCYSGHHLGRSSLGLSIENPALNCKDLKNKDHQLSQESTGLTRTAVTMVMLLRPTATKKRTGEAGH